MRYKALLRRRSQNHTNEERTQKSLYFLSDSDELKETNCTVKLHLLRRVFCVDKILKLFFVCVTLGHCSVKFPDSHIFSYFVYNIIYNCYESRHRD